MPRPDHAYDPYRFITIHTFVDPKRSRPLAVYALKVCGLNSINQTELHFLRRTLLLPSTSPHGYLSDPSVPLFLFEEA